MSSADFAVIPADELRSLLDDINNPSTFPDSWSQLLITMCLNVLPNDTQLVSQLWSNLNRTRRHIWLLGPDLFLQPPLVKKWIDSLLSLGDLESLKFAVDLTFGNEFPDAEGSTLNERIAEVLRGSDGFSPDQKVLLDGLLMTSPSIAEAVLYTNATWFASVGSSVRRFNSRVAEKIRQMPQAVPGRNMKGLTPA